MCDFQKDTNTQIIAIFTDFCFLDMCKKRRGIFQFHTQILIEVFFFFLVFLMFASHIREGNGNLLPVLLSGKSHGWRSLVGSPWGRQESGMTERLHLHFSLSCIGEGNGHPLQCSCLENPRDKGAWWAASMGSHRVGHD